ncbi:hypothetical protein K2173_016495 [Erythroxylum novogranatense]|uniref:FAS1 domain-containing protein n=1 Tax=Erythroxylum novogranatense TaxID=1862640 RepID=A0AAV8SGX8_9ROSI|nr:hypothetical protein K2173_016495 [Erythroxylum novogranatense]
MMRQSFFSFSLIFIFLSYSHVLAQSPASAPPNPPPPAPPAPPANSPTAAQIPASTSGTPDIDKILTKAGHFTIFVRLLKATGEDSELFTVLNTTNSGVTIFAPIDGSWSALKVGTLNTMSDEDKTELVKFHVVPKFISMSQFQTESNPVKTQAGKGGRVSFNITVSGASVNISTGLTNTSISATIYTDNQLAIYQVDKILLPLDIFTPKTSPSPAPALALEKPKKKPTSEVAESPVVPKDDTSGAWSLVLQNNLGMVAVGIIAAMFLV